MDKIPVWRVFLFIVAYICIHVYMYVHIKFN